MCFMYVMLVVYSKAAQRLVVIPLSELKTPFVQEMKHLHKPQESCSNFEIGT